MKMFGGIGKNDYLCDTKLLKSILRTEQNMRKTICYIAMLCLAAAVVYEAVRACRGNDAAQNVSQLTAGDYRGHEYVDLGLPSRLKWATCNIGAESPEQTGNYYSWGETEPKAGYSSHKYMDGSGKLTKYNVSEAKGTVDGLTTLTLDDDAAHRAWGGSWRMPTPEEVHELRWHCEMKDTVVNGHSATKLTADNGRYIILPHSGYINGTDTLERGEGARIWTSRIAKGECQLAETLCPGVSPSYNAREWGLNVRAVAR